MKNLKTLILTIFLISGTFMFSKAGTANKEVIGNWKYEVPTAPYGYEKGTLTFSEKEGNLAGEVKFADGYKIELKNISFENGVLKCGLYVDYEYVSVKANVENKKLTGTVQTPEGELKLTAEKQK